MFGDKTKQAVIQWQRANNLPGSGFFGPRSREKYAIITQSENQTVANAPSQSTNIANATIAQLQAQVAKLLAQVSSLQGSTTGSITKSDAETAIRHAHTTIDDVVDDLEDFDSNDIGNANTVIQNAKTNSQARKNILMKKITKILLLSREKRLILPKRH
jgi:peptidoglycan hydrolase-like protein with peptidoglycan-binding domain